MKIPCLRPAPEPEHTTIIPAYRAAIAKKKGLLPALLWGENNEANRELLDEVARSIDRGLLHERAYSEALLMQGASLLQVSEGIEGVLRARAAHRDAERSREQHVKTEPNDGGNDVLQTVQEGEGRPVPPVPTTGQDQAAQQKRFRDEAKQAANQIFCCPVVHTAPH